MHHLVLISIYKHYYKTTQLPSIVNHFEYYVDGEIAYTNGLDKHLQMYSTISYTVLYTTVLGTVS